MLRLCALPILVLAFIGFVTPSASHADYRKLFPAPAEYFKKTQYPQVRERARREFDIGYDKHSSPRVRAWHGDVLSISSADQRKQLEHIFAGTNARITYQEERADFGRPPANPYRGDLAIAMISWPRISPPPRFWDTGKTESGGSSPTSTAGGVAGSATRSR